MNDAGQPGAPYNNEGVRSRINALESARSIVADRFPDALVAVLAGSSADGTATATSDLDIVVLLDGPPAPYRETIRVEEIPVELFVHTSDSQLYWFERERSEGRCTLAHMLATGVALTGPETETTQAQARRWVAQGPEPWTTEQLEQRRYALTDALEDLVGASDPDERDAVAGQVLLMTAELALSLRGSWQGRGKWVVRQLRSADAVLAKELLLAHREAVATGRVAHLVSRSETVLGEAGGPLKEGFFIG
ncbi:MAG TPA: nucleotidyltransferase domain-containing protein [Acidimicrobiales bacterium]|nr:nucleotidyltransferase domain-containing protein [Acidimicrobiales bacterium]